RRQRRTDRAIASVADRGAKIGDIADEETGVGLGAARDVGQDARARQSLHVLPVVVELGGAEVLLPITACGDGRVVVHVGDRVGVLVPQRPRGRPAVEVVTKDTQPLEADSGRVLGPTGVAAASRAGDGCLARVAAGTLGVVGAATEAGVTGARATVGSGLAAHAAMEGIDRRAHDVAGVVRADEDLRVLVAVGIGDDDVLVPGAR